MWTFVNVLQDYSKWEIGEVKRSEVRTCMCVCGSVWEMKIELERGSLCSSFSADSTLLKESLLSETCYYWFVHKHKLTNFKVVTHPWNKFCKVWDIIFWMGWCSSNTPDWTQETHSSNPSSGLTTLSFGPVH